MTEEDTSPFLEAREPFSVSHSENFVAVRGGGGGGVLKVHLHRARIFLRARKIWPWPNFTRPWKTMQGQEK